MATDDGKARRPTAFKRFTTFAFRKKMLVFWTLGGVVVGIALGAGLYHLPPGKLATDIIGEGTSFRPGYADVCSHLSANMYGKCCLQSSLVCLRFPKNAIDRDLAAFLANPYM